MRQIFTNGKGAFFVFLWALSFSACHSSWTGSGFIEGEDYLVSSLVPGKVEKILVKEGATIVQGQELATLDSEEITVDLKNAEAASSVVGSELDRARSVLNRLPKGNPMYSRMKEVYNAGGISKAQLNQSSGGDSSLRSQAEILVKELEAQKAKSEAKVEELKALSHQTTLVAPAAGLVTKRYIQEGQRVAKGDSAFLITNLQEVYLQTSIPEKALGQIQIGQSVMVHLESLPGENFEGHLIQISPQAEFSPSEILTAADRGTELHRIKIKLPNPKGVLKPGMVASAHLSNQKRETP